MKYNKAEIMRTAHVLYRDGRYGEDFGECLRMAWADAKAINLAVAGYEEIHTYYGWTLLGYEVIHGEHATVKVEIHKPLKTKTTTTKAYFTREQVCEIGTQPYEVA